MGSNTLKYYKIIDNGKFVCVASSAMFAKFQNKHQIMLFCELDEAEYILTEKGIFHALWMRPEPSAQKGKYKTVEIIEISEDEYNTLCEVEEYEILPELEPQEMPEDEIMDAITQSTLDFVIDRKIKQMETATKNAIANGIELTLSDGSISHFSLTTQDQLNLISVKQMIDSGLEQIPYHADGQLCRYFSADDMKAIIDAATRHIAQYTTYFNSLHYWILNLRDIEEINSIYFGIEIPDEYKSEVLKDC